MTKHVLFICILLLANITQAEQPLWVVSPNEAGFSYAIVGSAMPQKMGKLAQYKQAQFAARQAFSANQEVVISSTQTSNETHLSSEFHSKSTISTHAHRTFSNLQQVDEWQDPNSGELFLLYVVK